MTHYEMIGKTPKAKQKETGIEKLKFGLKKFIKDERLHPFQAKHKKNKDKSLYAKARRNDWCSHFEHTGSVYEGLKANDGLEYDFMYVMKSDQFETREIPGQEGYYSIIQKPLHRKRSVLNSLLLKREVSNEESILYNTNTNSGPSPPKKQRLATEDEPNHRKVAAKRRG